ncbi:MAG: hypothetical protein CHACPFDD_00192 [Phycisphaerae bacterium]|nr:hypothetical protein [Phycisphaerae bacterium]
MSSLAIAGSAVAGQNYLETFDAFPDPSAITSAGWQIVTGTNNPTTVSTDFAINNNQNVVKLTTANDAGSKFTSGHLFIENDYLPSDPNNFGRGDAFFFTDEMIVSAGATAMNLNGAYLSVDYANGDAFNSGPSFHFAFRVGGSAWYIYETAFLGKTTSAVTHQNMSTDPLDDTFTCIPLIFEPWNGYNCDVRMIPNDSLARELTTAEWANVTAVGIYVNPAPYDAAPARFDNFAMTNFTLVGVPCDPADTNCDGSVNGFDVDNFVALLGGSGSPCSACAGDVNADGSVDGFDIDGFVARLSGP